MAKYLDSDGLLYFWQKLKTVFAGKVDKVEGKGLSTNDYTGAEKSKLAGIATNANNYTHPASSGNKHIPSGGSAGQILRWSADGTAVWGADKDTTYSVMGGASSTADGAQGLVPQPAKGQQAQFLRGDGTWAAPANTTYADMKGATGSTAGAHGLVPAPAAGKQAQFLRGDGTWATPTNTTYVQASASKAGLMSAADYSKLAAFGEASTYAKKADIANAYIYRGSVATYDKLPSSGQVSGDVYNVESDGRNYAWNGTVWDDLGGTFAVDTISNADIDGIVAK